VFGDPGVDVKTAFNWFIFYQNCFGAFLFVFFMLTFKHEPDVPPSKVATQEPPKRHLSEAFDELRINQNFRLIALVYAFGLSPYYSFGAMMALILTPFGLTVSQIARLGAAGVFVGAVSAIGFGVVLDRTRAYKKSLVGGCGLSLLTALTCSSVLANGPNYATVVCLTIAFTAVSIALLPLCMVFSVEVTYPLNASLANGIL